MPVQQAPQAPRSAARAPLHQLRRALLAGGIALLVLPLFASQASAALPLTPVPTFTTQTDENLADDQPGQKDLSLQGTANPAPGDLWVMWQWDVTSLSGGNTGDACALFDSDNDGGKVNFAVCVTIQGNPAVQASTSPRVYTCGDGKVDRCTSTYAQVSPINTACATNRDANDPFHSGQKDTQAVCHIALSDVGGVGTADLVNTCSYPSQQPTSDPSDCVLIPRDAFLKITKVASPNTGSFPFYLAVTGNAFPATATFTASGSQSSSFMPIRSDVSYKLKEAVPTNWTLSSASCTGASGSGSSNGTLSGDTISGIDASPDNQITCTFNDAQQTGAIEITKLRSGTSTGLAGAHFTIDGSGDYVTDSNGKVCVAGLSLGSHTVTETQAPAGHSLPATTSQNVDVTGAGTCASGAATVSFSDPVVNGTVNITKTGLNGAALNGATFTLYVDNPTVGGSRQANDTITTLTCTTGPPPVTDDAGKCSITDVPPGSYWVVETGVPNGYVAAGDKPVTVGIGGQPGQGDSVSVSFTDAAAPGTINVHKKGLGGVALGGAVFTLYYDADPLDGATGIEIEDTPTGQTCGPTSAAGDCSIANVPVGEYWLVETTVPNGYTAAPDTHVSVGLGLTPGNGAIVNVEISDPVVNGKVSITKTDDADNVLPGAEFTLYVDNTDVGGSRGAEDTITTKTCTTDANGKCDITDVAPGDYWVVETKTPNHYETAADQSVHVGVGSEPGKGDTVPVSFVDQRKHRVVVLVCHEGTDTLLSRDVTVGSVTKQSLDAGSLSDGAQKELCDIGGASFGDISGHGHVDADVNLAPAH